MKSAIITGASSGIGLEITKVLLNHSYKIYGLARDFSKTDLQHVNFIKEVCDITKTSMLEEKIKHIRNLENEISILVNDAGVGYYGPHEEINVKKLHAMIATNLEAPIILTHLLLRDLKKNSGYIINISSTTAKKASPIGCAYSATKAGLSHFSESLFEETRKAGVKVVTIHPDMTKTDFYKNANFKEGEVPESYITGECVANVVEMILNQREGTVLTDITIRPQKHMISKKK
ncbi:SDR family NAD(P)-dependent oxidoreductase [Clostridium sp. BL-8]|uniref:SDR family NAD(P)-dependent oxidoreductase n=1 Tax=Clostridium sp. BL-8 TaxID=349938 RepID=UPI00098C3A99|nr:SDR family NAD(P)-dependent oxidoreductase [Clostridium sp. BL-8]OOM77465.1 aklaviketone reductase DauE [Clostridium sp. BL-8]